MPRRESKILALLVACFLVGFAGFLLFRGRSAKEITPEEGVSHTHDEADRSDRQRDHSHTHDLSDDYGDLIDVSDMTELMDMTPADMLAMKWNSLEVTCDFSDYNRLAEEVDAIPVSGESKLSKEQEQNIKHFVTRVLYHNGRKEFDDFFSLFKESGETVNERLLRKAARKYLVETTGMADDELPEDPWKIVALYYNKRYSSSGWRGFVQDSSEIRVQIMKDKSKIDRMPGKQFWLIGGRNHAYWAHFGVPPVSLEEVITQRGEVLIADSILFIAHDESLSGEIYPYFIRHWFDPINNIWRPHRAVSYPRSHLNYHIGHTITY